MRKESLKKQLDRDAAGKWRRRHRQHRSDAALFGARNAFAYCASKGAVAQMTRAMAIDHARENIRVNCVCPGEIDTPMTASGLVKRGLTREQLADEIPLGRIANPDEIAKAVVFLASDDSSFMTGAMMSVDGGSTAGLIGR